MKKQIFILVMAFFAISFSNAYGQLKPHTINCLPSDALHPIAGQDYTYQIDVPVTPSPGTAWTAGSLKYKWFITQLDLNAGSLDNLFITNGVLRSEVDNGSGTGKFIATSSSDYSTDGVTVPVGADNILNLTWKNINYDAKKPLFVVISVSGNNTFCDPQNMKVFKIQPLTAFTIDIDNLTNLGAAHTSPATATTTADYGDLYSQCISNIVSSAFDETSGKVINDFGVNYLFYEVVAANWADSWNLGVQLTGIDPLETITVEWSKDRTFATGNHAMTTATAHAAVATVLQYTSVDNVEPDVLNTTGNIGATGESIFIRVTLDHSFTAKESYQGLNDEVIILSVDGMTNWDATLSTPAFTIGDVHWDNGLATANPCAALAPDGYTNDKSYQDVKARPTITNSTTAMPTPGLAPIMIPNP